MFVSIIIPLYNEEHSIMELLRRLARVQWPNFVQQHEIIVVDDCSGDASASLVESEVMLHPNYKLLRHTANRGKGAAVRTGLQQAQGDVFVIQDADLELSPDDIPLLLNTLQQLQVDFVNGSRYMPGVARPLASYRRYLANKLFSFLTSVLIDVRITDMACGYKVFRRSVFEKMQLHEDRFGFEAEITIKALRMRRNSVAEVPVQYYPRNYGQGKKFKSIDALKILWTITKYGLLRQS